MNRFATLIDRLAYEPRRLAKIRLLKDYFATTPDPDRGIALAAITGALAFKHAKPALIRTLISERTDPVLFQLSYDYVGDLSETIALMWPANPGLRHSTPGLAAIVGALTDAKKADLPIILADYLDALDETGRWAMLKLVTGGLRIGVSARLAKTALAEMAAVRPDEIDEIWHGMAMPYDSLFAWIDGRAPKPANDHPAPFRPPMLAHPIDEVDFATLQPDEFVAEWKWDGIRVQAVGGRDHNGECVTRLYSRTGEDLSLQFPDLLDALGPLDGVIDGELVIAKGDEIAPFATLQKRINRKTLSAKLLADDPAAMIAYDCLFQNGRDLRGEAFPIRRAALHEVTTAIASPRIRMSDLLVFSTWDELADLRRDGGDRPMARHADVIEGVMLKRKASPYLAGRPKGHWYKWKREPMHVDAVLMYAQRGHGKRSSFYSDYTFGVWRSGAEGDELVPVGKAYSGFTDDELKRIDAFVRKHTIGRFGPVREVAHDAETGLVLEIAFEGLQESTRHRSGLAMRFPRIARLRWDKPAREADRIETLAALLPTSAKTKSRSGL